MVYVCGILFLSCGVVMNARTGLGVAPMSTVPYLMYIIEGLSLGTASFIVYCVFVVASSPVRYPDVKILLQIPVSLLFSVFHRLCWISGCFHLPQRDSSMAWSCWSSPYRSQRSA